MSDSEDEREWERSVSWSKLYTYDTCGRQFKYKYVDEVEPEKGEGTGRQDGIDFHEFMDVYYDAIGDKPTEDATVEIAKEEFDEEQQVRYKSWVKKWHEWNTWLYAKFGEEHWKPKMTEKWVEVEIDGQTHHGYIDAIRYDPEREEYGVVDYKPNAKDNSRIKGQVAYYAAFLMEVSDIIEEDIEWGGTYGYKGGNYQTWDIHWASKRATRRKIDRLYELDTGYEPNFGFHCQYCNYEERCWLQENRETNANSLL